MDDVRDSESEAVRRRKAARVIVGRRGEAVVRRWLS